jgi:transposase
MARNVVKEIRKATRRKFSAEEKIRIVPEGLRGEIPVSNICRREGIAPTILAEIGDLRRFGRARQLTAYAGVSPRVVQSGTSVRGKTRMCKRGDKRVRQALYLSAMATLNTKTTEYAKRNAPPTLQRRKTRKGSSRRGHAKTTYRHARHPVWSKNSAYV